jgi:hypothetical protein
VADLEHIHNKLLARGWSHRRVAIFLYAISALFGLLSLALLTPGQSSLAIVLLVLGIGVVLGVQKLGYHEFFEIGRVARRALEQKQSIINNIAVRRGAERLARCDDWHGTIEALEDTFINNDFDDFKIIIKAKDSNAIAWSYRWQRPVPRWENDRVPSTPWSISLRLQVIEDKWDGSLELSRLDSSDLLLDINLLTSELRTELERACQRAIILDEGVQQPALGRALTMSTNYTVHRRGSDEPQLS